MGIPMGIVGVCQGGVRGHGFVVILAVMKKIEKRRSDKVDVKK